MFLQQQFIKVIKKKDAFTTRIEDREIPVEKRNAILNKLCPFFAQKNHTKFWKGLPVRDVEDLLGQNVV